MKILIVKTSSLGDVIHTLPAISDACRENPSLRCDWMIEEAFAEIPAWHPGVDRVIPVALRRWRKKPLGRSTRSEFLDLRKQLRQQHYDVIIDAQGLIKSAALARLANGLRYGLDFRSAREPLAALTYDHRINVPRHQHAIDRTRALFAHALHYPVPDTAPHFGIQTPRTAGDKKAALVLVHGTTWPSKHWPLAYWQALAKLAAASGRDVLIPWGNEDERETARQIAEGIDRVTVLNKLDLAGLRQVFSEAWAVVAVDSGPAHLAAATGVPVVTLYGATNALLTGCRGDNVTNLRVDFGCAPCLRRHCNWRGASTETPACYETLGPDVVWQALEARTKPS